MNKYALPPVWQLVERLKCLEVGITWVTDENIYALTVSHPSDILLED